MERRQKVVDTYHLGVMSTMGGRSVNILTPKPEDFHIGDIARGLSRMPRFSGQTTEFLSVAQHAIIVGHLCAPEEQFHGLNHDNAEAFLGDLPQPVKRLPDMRGFKRVETRLMRAIAQAFGFPAEKTEGVAFADHMAMRFEAYLFKSPRPSWALKPRTLTIEGRRRAVPGYLLAPRTPEDAERLFLSYFYAWRTL